LQIAPGKIDEKRETGKAIHSEKMFRFVGQLLTDYDISPDQLSEVLLSKGPGQYTGLRIGAAGVKGLLMGKNIPLLTLGTLEGFAGAFVDEDCPPGTLHAVIDARRRHLYHQHFRFSGDSVAAGRPAILTIDAIDRMLEPGDTVIGTDLERLSSFGNGVCNFYDKNYISAVNLIRARNDARFQGLFEVTDPAQFEPEYLTTSQVNNTKTA
jgi:tRNA threonylcarbamoyl adenosine modification protein YeaZ